MPTRILVVDDSPVERRRVGYLLELGIPGVVVTLADNGQSALETLSNQPHDLVISDLRMPQMSGWELVEKIHASGFSVPVVLMTSFGSEQLAVKALQAGAASYVAKNVLDRDLVKTINSVLDISRQRNNRRRVLSTLTSTESCFTLENDPALVSPLVNYLLEQMTTMKLVNRQQLTRIGVALQEALANAIHHGNLELNSELRRIDENLYELVAEQRRHSAPYADRKVTVTASLSPSAIRLVVADDGPGFDHQSAASSTTEVPMDRSGGRGLLLIRSFMDRVTFNARGNEITMVKDISPTRPTQFDSPVPHTVEVDVEEDALLPSDSHVVLATT